MNKYSLTLIFVFISWISSIACFAELSEDAKKRLKSDLPQDISDTLLKYFEDSNIRSSVYKYSHKIDILKSQTYDSNKKELKDVDIKISYEKTDKYPVDILNYKVDEKFLIQENKNTSIYDVPLYETEKNGMLKLLLLTDERGKIIWDTTYETKPTLGIPKKLLDVVKINDNKYMLIYIAQVVFYITYINLDYNIPIIESYQLLFPVAGGFGVDLPYSTKILTDNIIRLEYNDGSIEHWKVRMSPKDYEENQKITKYNSGNFRKQLIWWNGVGYGSQTGITSKGIRKDGKGVIQVMDKNNVKSWDYSNSDTEPTYKDAF